MQQTKLATYLGLTDDQLDEIGLDEDLIKENTGNSGEMVYSYYLIVPENTPREILDEKGWSVGDRVEIPLGVFDEHEESPAEPSSREIALEQALIAVVGAYRIAGGDSEELMKKAKLLIIDHSKYRIVGHPYVTEACIEIENSFNFNK